MRLQPLEAETGVHDWKIVRQVLRIVLREAGKVDLNAWSKVARADVEDHAVPVAACEWTAKQLKKKAIESKCKYVPVVSEETRLHVAAPVLFLSDFAVKNEDVALIDGMVVEAITDLRPEQRLTFANPLPLPTNI